MTSHRQILASLSWLLGGSIFRSFAGLIVTIFLARYLGPAEFGTFQYYIALLFVFLSFESMAHSQILSSKFINRPKNAAQILGSATLIVFITNLALVVGAFGYYFLNPNDEFKIFLILAGALIFRINGPIMCWFTSQLKASYSALAQSAGLATSYILTMIFIYWKLNIYTFAAAYSIQFLITAYFFLHFYRSRGPSLAEWSIDGALIRDILRESFPFLISATLFIVQSRLTLFFIRSMLDPNALGVYTVAFQLSEAWVFIGQAIVISLGPRIIFAAKNHNDKFLVKVFSFQLCIALAICICTSVAAKPFVNLLYGDKFDQTVALIQILVWSNIFSFWYLTQQAVDVEKQNLRTMSYRLLIGLPLTSLLTYILIKKYGLYGAGVSQVASYIYYGYASNILFKRSRGVFKIQTQSLLFWRYVNRAAFKMVLQAFKKAPAV